MLFENLKCATLRDLLGRPRETEQRRKFNLKLLYSSHHSFSFFITSSHPFQSSSSCGLKKMLEDSLDDLRQKGNHEFQQGNLDNAVFFYTAAIEKATETNNDQALMLNCCNRSACYYQMEDFEHAKEDAALAWTKSKESNVKAAYRLGKTLMALKELRLAMETLRVALAIESLQPKEEQSLQDLFNQALEKLSQPDDAAAETTVKGINRPVSIREFQKKETLG
jgi:tetratricopeptide (TPR) repeat protein